jgi:hypothetical protein
MGGIFVIENRDHLLPKFRRLKAKVQKSDDVPLLGTRKL